MQPSGTLELEIFPPSRAREILRVPKPPPLFYTRVILLSSPSFFFPLSSFLFSLPPPPTLRFPLGRRGGGVSSRFLAAAAVFCLENGWHNLSFLSRLRNSRSFSRKKLEKRRDFEFRSFGETPSSRNPESEISGSLRFRAPLP